MPPIAKGAKAAPKSKKLQFQKVNYTVQEFNWTLIGPAHEQLDGYTVRLGAKNLKDLTKRVTLFLNDGEDEFILVVDKNVSAQIRAWNAEGVDINNILGAVVSLNIYQNADSGALMIMGEAGTAMEAVAVADLDVVQWDDAQAGW